MAPSSTTTAESPRLDLLPYDLRLLVYCALDDLRDVVRLASTSTSLRAIWTHEASASIVSANVLPRAIPCLPDARDLVCVLEGPAPLARSALFRALHRHAQHAARAADVFEEVACAQYSLARHLCSSRVDPHLSAAERNLFIHVFHRLRILAAVGAPTRRSLLASSSPTDLLRMRDVLVWAQYMNEDMRKTRAGVDQKCFTGPMLAEVCAAVRRLDHPGNAPAVTVRTEFGLWNFYALFAYGLDWSASDHDPTYAADGI